MKMCPRCSAENKDDVSACWNCAAPLEGGDAGAVSVSDEVPVRRGLPWKPIVLVLVILAIAFVAYRFVGGPSAAKVAADYLDAKHNGRDSLAEKVTAADTVGTPLLPSLLLMGQYQVDERQRPTITDGRAEVKAQVSFRIDGDAVTDGKIAELAVRAEGELTRQVPSVIIVKKVGGQWKVDQAATSQRFKQDARRRFRDDKAWIADLFEGEPLPVVPGAAIAPPPALPPVTPAPKPAPPPGDDDDDDDDD